MRSTAGFVEVENWAKPPVSTFGAKASAFRRAFRCYKK
jgi:hypothetical protein